MEKSPMVEKVVDNSLSVIEVIKRYGKCLDLVPMDPHFNNITVGIYLKDEIITVWTYSKKSG